MKRFCITLMVGALALISTASTALAVPVMTSFTGRISDSSGPVDGPVSLTFRLYDSVSNGTMVWEESHGSVVANAGLVFVALGSVAPSTNGLDASVFDGGNMYLEIVVNGDVQAPRVPILSVPYALRASTADKLGSLSPDDVALSSHNHDGVYAPASHHHDSAYAALGHNHDGVYAAASHHHDAQYSPLGHQHGSADIIDNSLTADDLAPSSVTSSELASGAVTSSKLANGAVGTTQLASGAVSADKLAANSVTANAIAAGAVGTSEIADGAIQSADIALGAINYHHLNLPAGHSIGGATLTSGTNYIFPGASVTASYVTTCMVWTHLRVTAVQPSGTVNMNTARRLDGGTPSSQGLAEWVQQGYGSNYFYATSFFRWNQGAGTAEFGCRVSPTGSFVGAPAECRVQWICI